MKISPVSFGSLMTFTIEDGQPKVPVPYMVKMSFRHNNKLQGYDLQEDILVHEEKIDGTVHNAAANFCEKLDNLYKSKFPKGSKKVLLTEADFYVNPRETQKRYFLTAATAEEENKILKLLGVSNDFYTVKFRDKDW